MQSTYVLFLRTLLRDQRPFLLLLLLLILSLNSWNLNAPKTQHRMHWGDVTEFRKGRKVSEHPSVPHATLSNRGL